MSTSPPLNTLPPKQSPGNSSVPLLQAPFNQIQPSPETLVLLLAVLIGGRTGLGVVLFHYLIERVHSFMLENLMGLISGWGAWTLAYAPSLGGLIVGLIRWRWQDFGPSLSVLIAAAQTTPKVFPVKATVKAIWKSLWSGKPNRKLSHESARGSIFNLGQVRPGMSGSPLLNQRTGRVCAIVKFTRDRSSDSGGGAIPTRVILEQFSELRDLQRQFHGGDRRWSNLLTKPSNTAPVSQSDNLPSGMTQTNFDGLHDQTQTGANSINFIGGEHHHHVESSEVKQTIKKILMLSANPENTDVSRRTTEIRKVRDALQRAKHNAQFELHDRQDIANSAMKVQAKLSGKGFLINE